jgi:teichuronic acid biosynthesis glycosyltransferase TuaC
MKVLFISSGNTDQGISPIVSNQLESLRGLVESIDYFSINQKGLKGYFISFLKLRKFLKRNTYDILHAHYGLSGIISLFAKRKEKLIVSYMGDDLLGEHNIERKYTLKGKLLVFLNRQFIFSNDFTIVKSSEMALTIASIYNKTIIPNGVDFLQFKTRDKDVSRNFLGIPLEKKVILFVSNPSRPEKNYKLAIRAIEILDDSNIILLTIFNKPHSDLAIYYYTANVVLLTSFHEGSPNVIKEAMVCNCPIVSTNVGDVKWIIGDTPGCFMTSFDASDVADQLRKALLFSEETGRTNGRNRIIELSLNSESVAKKILDIYTNVLSL